MPRAMVVLGEGGWEARARRLARALSPVAVSPAAPRETVAALDAWGLSLMPRSARVRGVAMGLGILGARATSGVAARLTRMLAPADAPRPARLERHCRKLWVASLQSTGLLLRDGAAGGVVHDVGRWLQRRYPGQRGVRPLTSGAVHTAGLLYRASRRPPSRGKAGDRHPLSEPMAVAETLVTSYVVTTVGMGLARGFVWCRDALESYLGPGPSKRVLARLVNAGLWAGAAAVTYSAGVAYVGRANQRLESGYATPPISPLVSGSRDSLLPFADLGQQGRRYVTDVVTPELIEQVMGEAARAHPIRAYVGFNSEPLYQTGRAELALAEMERAGAFDRSVLLLISPTGTGWVDHTLIEAAEFLTRGDIATCCIQYARYPSFLSIQKVALGRGQFRLLLWGSASGWLACRPSGARGCWCSARAWAPGPARTSSCSRGSRASTTTGSTGPCGWGCRGWPSGPAAA
jgi:hypothetical protein